MADLIVLKGQFGKHPAGTEFELVKKAATTYVVVKPGGKGRLVIPSRLVDDTGTIEEKVELTDAQWEHVLKPMKKQLMDGVDIDDVEINDVAYSKASGLGESDAVVDIRFILEKEKGGKAAFFNKKLKSSVAPEIPGAMSTEESALLEGLLNGGTATDWTGATDLSVSGDSKNVVEEKPTLGKDQVFFTDITNGRLPKSGINYIVQQYASDHFKEEYRVDIPKVKEDHFWDCEVLECLVLAHQLREKALITGLPGTGKSSSVEQFAAWLQQPYTRLGGRGDLESSAFLGYAWADVEEINGEHISKMAFKPGLLTQGVQQGYLVTIDEVMKIPSYIQMAMQHLYEKDGYLTIDDMPGTKADKVVKPAESFLMILTDNVKGTGDNFEKFSSTQVQDTSTLDRISLNESLDYLQPADEVNMLSKKFPHADKVTVRKLVKFAGLIRSGYKQSAVALTLSPRGLIAILEMQQARVPIIRAIDLAFLNKIAEESESIAIKDMIRTVGIKDRGK